MNPGGIFDGLYNAIGCNNDIFVKMSFLNMNGIKGVKAYKKNEHNPNEDKKAETKTAVVRFQDFILLYICLKSFQHKQHTPCILVFWQYDIMKIANTTISQQPGQIIYSDYLQTDHERPPRFSENPQKNLLDIIITSNYSITIQNGAKEDQNEIIDHTKHS